MFLRHIMKIINADIYQIITFIITQNTLLTLIFITDKFSYLI